jgi:choline dehydrogenase-like flavoprotein
VLREAGAIATLRVPIRSFSHALGTLRLGADPARSVVDGDGRFRGIDNLLVTDASVFASAAAVNPSLTIAALALRAADRLTGSTWGRHEARSLLAGQAATGQPTADRREAASAAAGQEVDHG